MVFHASVRQLSFSDTVHVRKFLWRFNFAKLFRVFAEFSGIILAFGKDWLFCNIRELCQ